MNNGEGAGNNGDEYTELDLFFDMIENMEEEIMSFEDACKEDGVEVEGFHYAFFMYSCLQQYCKELNIHFKDVAKAYKAAEKAMPMDDIEESD